MRLCMLIRLGPQNDFLNRGVLKKSRPATRREMVHDNLFNQLW